MTATREESLDERTQKLLRRLVECYIDTGAPVASRTLAQESEFSVSSATVRNIMAELESQGLVTSPHTSAGKVPTPNGLRLFVDSLIRVQPLDPESLQALRAQLDPNAHTSRQLVTTASDLLSRITRLAGLVTLPQRETVTLRQVEFLPLTGQRILVILVVNEKEVENRIIRTHRQYAHTELRQAANFINEHCAGCSLTRVREQVIESMRHDKDRIDAMMAEIVHVASAAFEPEADGGGDYVVAGERNLLSFVSGADMDAVRELFATFSHKRDMLHLLDRCLDAEGVHLFIGAEAGYEPLGEYSMVTAPYEVEGRTAGALGVVGPTRMAYQRVIPIVDATARLLGAALRDEGAC